MFYEDLLNDTELNNIILDENYNFKGNTKGLYIDGNIALSSSLKNTQEKKCILAEELGHYYTSAGDILDQTNVMNRKQEHRARVWAYNKMVGLSGIIEALKHNCYSIYEMANYLDVTEEFLVDTIKYYKSKYGIYVNIDNYTIYFEPLGVFELYN